LNDFAKLKSNKSLRNRHLKAIHIKTGKHIALTLVASIAISNGSVVWAQENTSSEESTSQSGYDDIAGIGGPTDVAAELEENDRDRDSIYEFDTLQRNLAPYFNWKRGLNEKYGLSFGASAYLLYQQADSSPGEDNALGIIFRQQGSWNLTGRGSGSPGSLQWRFESRSNVGGFIAPGQLGGELGVATLAPGFAYSHNFDFDLAIINWTQGFNDKTAGFAAGRLGFDVYLDAFPFQTFSRGFINRAFILNPSMGTTGIGALGAVVKGFVTDNIWLGAQAHDANAASGKFDFDTVGEGEWLKGIEIGWTPGIASYKTQRVQFTYWEKDARALAGTTRGSGWVVSAAYQMNDTYFPFVRFGHSDGGAGVAAESAFSAGVQISQSETDIWSIGAGWAKPSERTFGPGLDNETVLETSYQFRLSKNFTLTPDVQVIFNPANNPGKSSVWVVGIRGILTL